MHLPGTDFLLFFINFCFFLYFLFCFLHFFFFFFLIAGGTLAPPFQFMFRGAG